MQTSKKSAGGGTVPGSTVQTGNVLQHPGAAGHSADTCPGLLPSPFRDDLAGIALRVRSLSTVAESAGLWLHRYRGVQVSHDRVSDILSELCRSACTLMGEISEISGAMQASAVAAESQVQPEESAAPWEYLEEVRGSLGSLSVHAELGISWVDTYRGCCLEWQEVAGLFLVPERVAKDAYQEMKDLLAGLDGGKDRDEAPSRMQGVD